MFDRFPPEFCHKCGGEVKTAEVDKTLFENRWECQKCGQGYLDKPSPFNQR